MAFESGWRGRGKIYTNKCVVTYILYVQAQQQRKVETSTCKKEYLKKTEMRSLEHSTYLRWRRKCMKKAYKKKKKLWNKNSKLHKTIIKVKHIYLAKKKIFENQMTHQAEHTI